MPTPSPKMGLALPGLSDQFSTADIKANWEKIDAAPGTHICTSSSRPTWTAAQAGRKIFETDTRLEWFWTGSEWQRAAPVGLLKKSNGDWAIGSRTSDFTTSSANFVKVVSLTAVSVPAGNRTLRVDVAWQKARNGQGSNFAGAIFRSDTADSGPKLAQWNFATAEDNNSAGGGTYFALIPGGLAAGNYDFSMQVNAPTGQTTISATATSPALITVTEI